MKPFRRKPVSKSASSPLPRSEQIIPEASEEFYGRCDSEMPLDGSQGPAAFRQVRRTSCHMPVDQRESNDSEKHVFLFLFRVVLILLLLGGGFFGLKVWLNHFQDPSEKETAEWAEKEVLMQRDLGVDAELKDAIESSLAQNLTTEQLGERLAQWQEAEHFLRTANDLYRQGILEEAVKQLELALLAAPANTSAQRLLLTISMESGAYEEAVSLCLRLLEKDPEDLNVQGDLLRSLMQCGRVDSTVLLAERILDLRPNDLAVLEIAAQAYVGSGQLELAEERFSRILKNDRAYEAALAGLGDIYRSRGEWQDAIPYYSELVRKCPQPVYYHALAACYAQRKEAGKAVILMGQAYSLYGEESISGWFEDAEFDPVRETVEFRSFTDRVVGLKIRENIEQIRRMEKKKEMLELPDSGAPDAPSLELRQDQ